MREKEAHELRNKVTRKVGGREDDRRCDAENSTEQRGVVRRPSTVAQRKQSTSFDNRHT